MRTRYIVKKCCIKSLTQSYSFCKREAQSLKYNNHYFYRGNGSGVKYWTNIKLNNNTWSRYKGFIFKMSDKLGFSVHCFARCLKSFWKTKRLLFSVFFFSFLSSTLFPDYLGEVLKLWVIYRFSQFPFWDDVSRCYRYKGRTSLSLELCKEPRSMAESWSCMHSYSDKLAP